MLFRFRFVLCVVLAASTPLTLPGQSHTDVTQRAVEAHQTPAELPQSPAELDRGRRLFETHCAPCHGPRGEGGKGPTLAQPSLPRASDDASLLRIIRGGIDGTEMPGARLER